MIKYVLSWKLNSISVFCKSNFIILSSKDLLSKLISTYSPKYIWLPKNCIINFVDARILFSNGDYGLIERTCEITYELHEDLALLLTTSGSTGSPKLVKITLKNKKT